MGNDRTMSSFMGNGDLPRDPAKTARAESGLKEGRANAIGLIDSTPGKTPMSQSISRFADVFSTWRLEKRERKKKRKWID